MSPTPSRVQVSIENEHGECIVEESLTRKQFDFVADHDPSPFEMPGGEVAALIQEAKQRYGSVE